MVTSLRAVGSQSSARAQVARRPRRLIAVGVGHHRRRANRTRSSHFDRGLRSHLVDAGHVVDRIADQRQVVDDPFGRHPELGRSRPLGRAARTDMAVAAHGVHEHDELVDQSARGPCRRWRPRCACRAVVGLHGPGCRSRRRPRCLRASAAASRCARTMRVDHRNLPRAGPRASKPGWPCIPGTIRRGKSCPAHRTPRRRAWHLRSVCRRCADALACPTMP